MAKVTPKVAPKTAPKADAKADAKAAQATKIAALSGPIAEVAGAFKEADESRTEKFLEIRAAVIEAKDENSLEKSDVQALVRLAFADAYDIDAADLDKGASVPAGAARSAYVYSSQIMSLVFPKFDKVLSKELALVEKGESRTINSLLDSARKGKVGSKPGKKGRPEAGSEKNKVFETEDAAFDAFAALLTKMRASDIEWDTIETKTVELIEEHKQA